MKRLTLWLVAILAFLIVLFVLSVVIFVLTGRSALRNQLAEWEMTGGAASLQEYVANHNHSLTEPEKLAGDTWQRAIAAVPDNTTTEAQNAETTCDGAADADLNELGQSVALASEALALAHAATAANVTRWPLVISDPDDVTASLLEYLHPSRTLLRFIKGEAVLRARNGDLDGALDSVEAGLALSRYISSQPCMISHLVGLAIQYDMSVTAWDVIQQADNPADLPPLEDIQTALEQCNARSFVLNTLMTDGLSGIQMFLQTVDASQSRKSNPLTSAPTYPAGIGSLIHGHDGAAYLDYLQSSAVYYSLPVGERADSAAPEQPPVWATLSRLIVPTMERYGSTVTKVDAKTLLARQALQLTEYYRQNDAFPSPADYQSLATNEEHGYTITYALSDDGHTVTLACTPDSRLNQNEAGEVSQETWELTW